MGAGLSSKKKVFTVCILLIFTFIWIYRPHLDYNYPLHADEWAGMNEARSLLERGEVSAKHELGFFMFLASIDKFFDLKTAYQYLPAVFACISSLALFILLSRKTNFYTGIFAMIFFAFLPSNINILGIEFFVAMTFSIPLIYLFALFFTEGFEEENKKKILIAGAILLLTAMIHPSMAMLIFSVALVYSIFNYNQTKEIIRKAKHLWIIPLLGASWMLFVLWKGNLFLTISNIFSKITFEIGYSPYQVNYFIPFLYGGISSLFAAIGIWKAFKKRKMIFFNIWFLFGFLSILFFIITKVSLLASYQRIIYFTLLGLIPFSAYGLTFFVYKTKKYIKPIFMILLVFTALLYFHYTPSEDIKPSYLIDETEYKTLQFISKINKTIIMAPVEESLAVYSITGHYPIYGLKYYTNLDSDTISEGISFYSNLTNCSEKKMILEKNFARTIWSKEKIDCGFEEIFSDDEYVYRYDLSKDIIFSPECEYQGQVIECINLKGEKGARICLDYKGDAIISSECFPRECNMPGEFIDCELPDGKPGIQTCMQYDWYATKLTQCRPYECKPNTTKKCVTQEGKQGIQTCTQYDWYATKLNPCLPYECKPNTTKKCVTQEGKQGIQTCTQYDWYATKLNSCLPYECDKAGETKKCTTEEGKTGTMYCKDYKGYGKIWSSCIKN